MIQIISRLFEPARKEHGSAVESAAQEGNLIRLGRLGNLDGQLFAECAERALQLVQPGSVPEIEQAIHLGHVAVQPAGEVGFAHLGCSHRGIEGQLGFCEHRQCGEWPLDGRRGIGMSRRSAI